VEIESVAVEHCRASNAHTANSKKATELAFGGFLVNASDRLNGDRFGL